MVLDQGFQMLSYDIPYSEVIRVDHRVSERVENLILADCQRGQVPVILVGNAIHETGREYPRSSGHQKGFKKSEQRVVFSLKNRG